MLFVLGVSWFVATTPCTNEVRQFFEYVPLIVTRCCVIVLKICLTLLVSLFTGDPINKFIQFISSVQSDLFGGLGAALVNFVIQLGRALLV